MAGFHRSQCVSDEKDRRLRYAWGRSEDEQWNLIVVPLLLAAQEIEHEDIPDEGLEETAA
jgi:hypothetical protein